MTYTIADREFTQEELVLGQIQWLKRRLVGYTLTSLTTQQVMDLVVDEGPALLAIILIPVGMTRAEKVRAGLKGVEELEAWLQQYATPEGVAAIASDFFRLNRAVLMRSMSSVQTLMGTETSGAGSTTPSSPSVMATSPSPDGSSST